MMYGEVMGRRPRSFLMPMRMFDLTKRDRRRWGGGAGLAGAARHVADAEILLSALTVRQAGEGPCADHRRAVRSGEVDRMAANSNDDLL